jgi:hypothetical protein
MTPFNPYLALTGTPVCTRDGRRVYLQLHTTGRTSYVLEGLIEGNFNVDTWNLKGELNTDQTSPHDLFLVTDDNNTDT